MRRTLPALLGLALLLTLGASPGQAAPRHEPDRAAVPTPTLRVSVVARGLDLPWDVQALPSGRLLITERTSKRLLTLYRGRLTRISYPTSTVWAQGETGLMSLAVDPDFQKNRRFYTCQGSYRSGGGHDIKVMAWRLGPRNAQATLQRRLLTGLPTTSGRHGGCRLLIGPSGALVVGTGDATVGTNPRNRASLGGKTLRLNRFSGRPWPSNPFIRSDTLRTRYLLTFGHRNVQGLAVRANGQLWSVEHGSDRDDEVNRLVPGGDYGWNPVPGYDESVPMTDQSLPGPQIGARWRSGAPTLATSGATFVSGRKWGSYSGTMAVAALKANRMLFIRFDRAGRLVGVRTPPALRQFGRLRSVSTAPNGDLLVTTSNGGGRDRVLRVTPSA